MMTDTQILDWLQEEGVLEIDLREHGGMVRWLFAGSGNLREQLAEKIVAIQRERE